jgi:hypothetical protein
MANQQIGNGAGVAAVHTGSGQQRTNISGDNTSQQDGYVDTDLSDISAMRTRLAAINGALYTAAYLDKMTKNDMVYAIRLNDNPSTIKQ